MHLWAHTYTHVPAHTCTCTYMHLHAHTHTHAILSVLENVCSGETKGEAAKATAGGLAAVGKGGGTVRRQCLTQSWGGTATCLQLTSVPPAQSCLQEVQRPWGSYGVPHLYNSPLSWRRICLYPSDPENSPVTAEAASQTAGGSSQGQAPAAHTGAYFL